MFNHYVFFKHDGLMVFFDTAMPQEDIFTLFGTVDDDEFEEKMLTIQDLHVKGRTYNFARDDLRDFGMPLKVQYVKIPRQAISNEAIIKAICAAHEPFIAIDTAELVSDGRAWAKMSLDDQGVFHVEPVPKDQVLILDSMSVMPKKEVKKPFYRELEKKSRSGK